MKTLLLTLIAFFFFVETAYPQRVVEIPAPTTLLLEDGTIVRIRGVVPPTTPEGKSKITNHLMIWTLEREVRLVNPIEREWGVIEAQVYWRKNDIGKALLRHKDTSKYVTQVQSTQRMDASDSIESIIAENIRRYDPPVQQQNVSTVSYVPEYSNVQPVQARQTYVPVSGSAGYMPQNRSGSINYQYDIQQGQIDQYLLDRVQGRVITPATWFMPSTRNCRAGVGAT